MNRFNNLRLIIILLGIGLFTLGCDLFNTARNSKYTTVSIIPPISRSLSDEICSYELTVSANDFDDIVRTITDEAISLDILSGTNRTFHLKMYDNTDCESSSSLLLFEGETTVNLKAGENVNLQINAKRSVKYIFYESNGATSGTVPIYKYYNDDTNVTIPGNTGNLFLNSYIFVGWNTSPDGSGTTYQGGSTLHLSGSDITLYAMFTQLPTYNISYNLNGGEGTLPVDSNNYIEDSSVLLSVDPNINKDGYNFSGWSLTSDGEVITTYNIGNSDTVLYAIWSLKNTYDITYNINGGVGNTPSVGTFLEGSDVTLDDGTGLSSTGKTFMGWSYNTYGSWITGDFEMPSSDITLYAMWIDSTAYAFTTGGAKGQYGPDQSTIDLAYTGTNNSGLVTIVNGFDGYQLWDVPSAGFYKIDVYGASGGVSENGGDSTGAYVSGVFNLDAGTQLIIVVGQEGETKLGDYDAGSGGGSFVIRDDNTTPVDSVSSDIPLMIAGGGSGQSSDGDANPGSSTQIPTGGLEVVDGVGSGGGDDFGPGGGGFRTDGEYSPHPECAGLSYFNGLTGGDYYGDGDSIHGIGGFGGGSGGSDGSGSAGGGYTGGTGRNNGSSGGGGSYNTGAEAINTEGSNIGDGLVLISSFTY